MKSKLTKLIILIGLSAYLFNIEAAQKITNPDNPISLTSKEEAIIKEAENILTKSTTPKSGIGEKIEDIKSWFRGKWEWAKEHPKKVILTTAGIVSVVGGLVAVIKNKQKIIDLYKSKFGDIEEAKIATMTPEERSIYLDYLLKTQKTRALSAEEQKRLDYLNSLKVSPELPPRGAPIEARETIENKISQMTPAKQSKYLDYLIKLKQARELTDREQKEVDYLRSINISPKLPPRTKK